MAKIADIITKLLERTNEGKVSWKTTADENTFIAVVGNISTEVVGYTTARARQEVLFRILSSEGREIERYTTRVGDGQDISDKLIELYAKAKRTALGVDDALDDLLKALEE